MALLVLAPTPEELAALGGALLPAKPAEMLPYPVRNKGRDILFYATGVGPLNAAMAAGYCFGLTSSPDVFGHPFKIDLCLLAGVAGAFDLERCPLGGLFLVEEEIWPEYGLNDGVNVVARAFRFPQLRISREEAVFDRARLAPLAAVTADEKRLAKLREELPGRVSLTVAGVTASFARAMQLQSLYHADLENMEGFSAALACLRTGVPCVEIRSVSNKIGPRAKDEKDFPGALKSLEAIPSLLGIF